MKKRHGHSSPSTPTYNSWRKMKYRCLDPNATRSKNGKSQNIYKDYGGRGIKICERWLKFENFLEDMGIRPEGHTLDRKYFDGNYCKDNCKWSTITEQNQNRRKPEEPFL
jgi:hypothetical protein